MFIEDISNGKDERRCANNNMDKQKQRQGERTDMIRSKINRDNDC